MKNNNLSPITEEALSTLSGVYSTVFWDTIYEVSGSIESIKAIQTVIATLYSLDRNKEAMLLIGTLYDLLGLEYPEELQVVEQNEELHSRFVGEWLKDIEDLMYDYTAE